MLDILIVEFCVLNSERNAKALYETNKARLDSGSGTTARGDKDRLFHL